MVSRLQANPVYCRRVEMHVIEILNRIDSHRKPVMIAAVFAAFAKGEIEIGQLNRLHAAIDSLTAFAIDFVREFVSGATEPTADEKIEPSTQTGMKDPGRWPISDEIASLMVNAGLATFQFTYGGMTYGPN